jgi:hypothetical protein
MTKSTYKKIKMMLAIFSIGSGFAFIFLLRINQKGEPFKDNALEWKESGWIRYCDINIIYRENGWQPKIIEEDSIPCEKENVLHIYSIKGDYIKCPEEDNIGSRCVCPLKKIIRKGVFVITRKNKNEEPAPPIPEVLNFSCEGDREGNR